MCTVNKHGEYVKTSYFARSHPQFPNQFEVFASTDFTLQQQRAQCALTYLPLVLPEQKGHPIQKAIVAFRKGENVIDYRGNETIRSLFIVASGLGIVPILQVLKTVFTSDDFAMDKCHMLWINDKKDDFILDEEVAYFEDSNPDNLEVLRVANPDIHIEDSPLNPDIKAVLGNYTTGSVAMIAGSVSIAEKFIPSFEALQYPAENIIYIPI